MTCEQEALDRIICKDSLMLTPDEIAPLLDSSPQTIRKTARQNPQLIGYPFTFNGSAMKIPKKPFLQFLGIEVKGL